jgi:ATP-dependent RNA helicase DHX37/DHR1
MIILGQQFGNMPYIISIVSGLSVGDPFISLDEMEGFKLNDDGEEVELESEALRSKRQNYEKTREQFSALDPGCDVIRLLCAIGAYEAAGATDEFCQRHFLRVKLMREIRKLRIQIMNIVNNQLAGIVAPVQFTSNLAPPSKVQIRTIKQIVAAAYLDRIAIRADLLDATSSKRNPVNVLRTEYSPLTTPMETRDEQSGTFIHPNSALAKLPIAPEYVVYSDLRESQNTGRLRLLPLTTVAARDIEPLAKGTPLVQYSKPLNYPPPRIFTEDDVMKKEVYVVPRFGMQGKGWELPSVKQVETMSRR